jgi:hypothetical protein
MRRQRVARISVCLLFSDRLHYVLSGSLEWYTNWRNRGYLAPRSIAKMPIVQERWRQLSEQLTRFKSEEFAKR